MTGFQGWYSRGARRWNRGALNMADAAAAPKSGARSALTRAILKLAGGGSEDRGSSRIKKGAGGLFTLVLMAAVGGAVWWFFIRKKPAPGPAPSPSDECPPNQHFADCKTKAPWQCAPGWNGIGCGTRIVPWSGTDGDPTLSGNEVAKCLMTSGYDDGYSDVPANCGDGLTSCCSYVGRDEGAGCGIGMWFTGAWTNCPHGGDCTLLGIGCTPDKGQGCAYGDGKGRGNSSGNFTNPGCTGGSKNYFDNKDECGGCSFYSLPKIPGAGCDPECNRIGPPDAGSCHGWGCSSPGQYCPADADGSAPGGYCCKDGQWGGASHTPGQCTY